LPDNEVSALAPGVNGALWVGTQLGGLARLDKNGRWQTYSKASTNGGLPSDDVLALMPGADGALWVGTQLGGLARLDKDGRWQTYSKASTNGGLPSDGVRALARGADGAVWVGTGDNFGPGGGLARLDENGRWQTYSKASTNGGLPGNHVQALARGADGALLVGTIGGLARLDKDGRWQTYNKANTKGGLPDNGVRALAPGADGAVWVGTGGNFVPGGGLARLDKDGRWQSYSTASTNGGMPSDKVSALAPGPDGALWVGTFCGRLARRDKDGHWQT
jgi:ligand-binding sensor domain-containing protein